MKHPYKIKTNYEWVIETVCRHDDEDMQDIIDHDWQSKIADLDLPLKHTEETFQRIALAFSKGSDCEGVTERQYAYPENGALPEFMDAGRKIPAKYHREFAAHLPTIGENQ
jgi:hypothetical protein